MARHTPTLYTCTHLHTKCTQMGTQTRAALPSYCNRPTLHFCQVLYHFAFTLMRAIEIIWVFCLIHLNACARSLFLKHLLLTSGICSYRGHYRYVCPSLAPLALAEAISYSYIPLLLVLFPSFYSQTIFFQPLSFRLYHFLLIDFYFLLAPLSLSLLILLLLLYTTQ